MTNLNDLSLYIHNLMAEGDFQKAEEVLSQARSTAESQSDRTLLNYVLTELIGLYQISEPPLWTKAEALSNERENLVPSAQNMLQTAMILYYGLADYARVVPKVEKAIEQGRQEGDDKAVYTSLSLLGQTYLELGQMQKAVAILAGLEEMVANRRPVVIGDETSFLERLRTQGLEVDRIAKLASVLSPICRDASFKERLEVLTRRR